MITAPRSGALARDGRGARKRAPLQKAQPFLRFPCQGLRDAAPGHLGEFSGLRSSRRADAQIAANLAGQKVIDLTMAGEGGSGVGAGIAQYRVATTFAENDATRGQKML